MCHQWISFQRSVSYVKKVQIGLSINQARRRISIEALISAEIEFTLLSCTSHVSLSSAQGQRRAIALLCWISNFSQTLYLSIYLSVGLSVCRSVDIDIDVYSVLCNQNCF